MPYDTATMLSVVDQLDRNTPFLLGLFFPTEITFDTAFIDFDVVDEDLRLAPFVSPRKEGRVMTEQGSVQKKFTPAYIKPKTPVLPDRVLKRKAGEPRGGSLSASARRDAIVVDILQAHDRAIKRRWEWMAAQAVRTAQVVVEGEDYPAVTVDFQRDPNLTEVLAGAARWSDAASDPVQDLEDWFALMEADATHVIFSSTAFNTFARHAKVKDLIDTRRGSDTEFEMAPATNLASFKGRLGGAGPELWTYKGYYKDGAGAKQLYIPEGEVVVGSTATDGVRAFGAIHDAKAGYQALPVYPKSWVIEDPSMELVMSQSAPLMIPKRPNATFKAQVL